MEASERNNLRAALDSAFNKFITTFSAFDEAAVNTSLVPGRWTAAQVVWHIVLATDGVPDNNTRPTDRPATALLPGIRMWWEDFNQKFTSPESLEPDTQPRSKQSLLTELNRVRAKDLAIIENSDLTLLCLDFELPHTGYLTRVEWLWFIEMHLKRHTYQLENMLSGK